MKCFSQSYPAVNWTPRNSVWLGENEEKYLRTELLKTHESSRDLVTVQILILEVQGGPQDVCISSKLRVDGDDAEPGDHTVSIKAIEYQRQGDDHGTEAGGN